MRTAFAALAIAATTAAGCKQAVDDYRNKSKATEATLELNLIGKLAKVKLGDLGALPTGTGALLPPGDKHCCAPADHKCAAAPAAFAADPGWAALEFSIDEPTHYQYSFASDGKELHAYAIGDLDCDGEAATYTLSMSVGSDGNPHTLMIEPPKGVY